MFGTIQPGNQPAPVFFHRGNLDGFYSVLRVNQSKGIYTIVLGNGGKTTDRVIDEVLAITQTLFES